MFWLMSLIIFLDLLVIQVDSSSPAAKFGLRKMEMPILDMEPTSAGSTMVSLSS